MIFPVTEVRLADPYFSRLNFWSFLNTGAILAILPSLGISLNLYNISKMKDSTLAKTSATSLSILGCSLSGLMDFCGSSSHE